MQPYLLYVGEQENSSKNYANVTAPWRGERRASFPKDHILAREPAQARTTGADLEPFVVPVQDF